VCSQQQQQLVCALCTAKLLPAAKLAHTYILHTHTTEHRRVGTHWGHQQIVRLIDYSKDVQNIVYRGFGKDLFVKSME